MQLEFETEIIAGNCASMERLTFLGLTSITISNDEILFSFAQAKHCCMSRYQISNLINANFSPQFEI